MAAVLSQGRFCGCQWFAPVPVAAKLESASLLSQSDNPAGLCEASSVGGIGVGRRGGGCLLSNRRHRHGLKKTRGKAVAFAKAVGVGEREVDIEADVVIVGAGVIGLAIAHELLLSTQLSVALIEAAKPCAGATGAGQGYIWLGHRQPGSPGWQLAQYGKDRWQQLNAELIQSENVSGSGQPNPLGWLKTGSLLLATKEAEVASMKLHVDALQRQGVDVALLNADEARREEPMLGPLPPGATAALVPEDCQLDAELAVEVVLERCRNYRLSGRYHEVFNEKVTGLLTSADGKEARGVRTPMRSVRAREGVVAAAGAWTAGLMAELAHNDPTAEVVPPVLPRKGHLLALSSPSLPRLRRALMEFEYTSNYRTTSAAAGTASPKPSGISTKPAGGAAVTMTVTSDHAGKLLIGSSREFSGFDTSVAEDVVDAMTARAAEFLPFLGTAEMHDCRAQGRIKTGLRPYSMDGKPFIGPVDSLPGLILATGHEGSGLCFAWGTAELVKSALLRSTSKVVDAALFSPSRRLHKIGEVGLSQV